MHLSSLFSMAALLAPRSAVSVTCHTMYDEPSRPLSEVACWNKKTGMIADYDWQTQANVATSRILAMDTITGPDSPACASCWILEYEDRARPFLAIDHADSGFTVSLSGMNSLTNGKGVRLGRIEVNATQVDMLNCGLYDPPSDEL